MYGFSDYRSLFRCGFLLIIGMLAAIVALGVAASGEDIALFPKDEGVSLFESPLELFPLEQPTGLESSGIELLLFETPKIDAKTARQLADDFGRNHKPTPAGKRPVMYCYAPDWCKHCEPMCKRVADGDRRIDVRWVKGDETKFPQCVRDYAKKNVYPVQYWATPKGLGALHHGVKSLDELVEFVRLEPGETPPSPVPPRAIVSIVGFKE